MMKELIVGVVVKAFFVGILVFGTSLIVEEFEYTRYSEVENIEVKKGGLVVLEIKDFNKKIKEDITKKRTVTFNKNNVQEIKIDENFLKISKKNRKWTDDNYVLHIEFQDTKKCLEFYDRLLDKMEE